ncbi:beta-glucosidase bogh3b [Phtheirospermum japonicum]|uniref:Beta-glucosidase bogh3b n=1 Tax=Phtheirospermum japonicum TaxID=374723 RepID=A0A830C4Z4_9LAMI|nr:beta-glucosidase bogh3b [Phtheirospermum japonicum]
MDCIYKDPNAPIEARVKDLLSRMTLLEKIGQITQIERSVATPSVIKDRFIGSVLSGGGSKPFENANSSGWADMIDGFQEAALETRLGIPIIYGTDAVHGNNNVHGATIFPHNVGLGATRDADLVKRIGEVTALEVRASGAQYAFAPCVAVSRDPRWGRSYESYSENTEIVRKMACIVSGLQGQPPEGHPKGYPFLAGRKNVLASAKHFVGDGGTESGINEGNTIISYEDLEKIHIAPYLDCLSQGVCTVMVSYSSWNGRKLHTDYFLLTEVLKTKLGFKGIVITDWEALDRLYAPHGSNYRESIRLTINAGIDMVMVPFRYELFLDEFLSLVEAGEISMARIDDAVERILRVKFISGVFEHPLTDRSLLDVVGCKPHRELAREAVRKSLVLLKNGKDPKRPFLPLDKKAKRILVAGTHADNLGYQCGGWTITWEGKSGRITEGTTILDAIKEVVDDKTEVIYEENPSPETLSRQDISFAVVAIGEGPYVETGGDDPVLKIPFGGAELASSVADRVPTLVILVTGRPLVLEPLLLEKIDGLVVAWLPGTEGRGITDVILGDYAFQGRLPMTWFRSVDQLPIHAAEDERQRAISNENTTHESAAFKAFQRRNGPPGLNKERNGVKAVEEGNKHCTECNKDGHSREVCFKLIGYPEWWLGKKGEKIKGKAACVGAETGPILGLTHEDYQLFLKHFSGLANGKSSKPTANMAHKEDVEVEWIIDSGCTEYITHLSNVLVNKKEISLEELVVIPTGESILVKGKRDHTLPGGAKVKGVLYIPDFKCNLLSDKEQTPTVEEAQMVPAHTKGNEPNDVSHEPYVVNESGHEKDVLGTDEMFFNNEDEIEGLV